MKKLALLLFGMSYCEYTHWYIPKKFLVDFRDSVGNYKQVIFRYFMDLGYEIDVFIATNILNDNNIKIDLLNAYNPKRCLCVENDTDNTISRNIKIKMVIDCCLEYSIKNNIMYDHCLITRFDLLFMKNFDKSNIQLNKFNIVSELEIPRAICDNFYLFPFNILNLFYEIVKKNMRNKFHFILNDIENIANINFILSERTHVPYLSFYKIIRKEIEN